MANGNDYEAAKLALWPEAAATPVCAGPGVAVDGFVPATSFQGARLGFVFQRGDSGVGYYRDSAAAAAQRVIVNGKEIRTMPEQAPATQPPPVKGG